MTDGWCAGRTIREFVFYTLFVPQIYVFFWFSVFGGLGIRMQRSAENANITCDSILGGGASNQSESEYW